MRMDRAEGSNSSGLKTMQLNDQKAGMQGLDKEMINKVIYEASKGTPYFSFQQKRQQTIDVKVKEFLGNIESITDVQKKESEEKMDALGVILEADRDLSHSIVHIDMDAFYAAVEMEDNQTLKAKPMAVGSSSMLSTSNYLARKYGVRAAMPGFIAKKLCPELVIVPGNFEKYRKVSHKIRDIVKSYDPDYCAASLDEVYLDLTNYVKNMYKKQLHEEQCMKYGSSQLSDEIEFSGDEENLDDLQTCQKCLKPISCHEQDQMAHSIVQEIREKIFDATNLTASAGIAPNTMLAKVCSDQNKPNGQYQIKSTVVAVNSFISSLPVKKVSGIGPVQGQILNAIGINTCADMWEKRGLVDLLFKPSTADFYMRVALGIGSTTVKSDHVRKSIGVEETFKEIHLHEDLHNKCEELCHEMIEDLKSHNMLGKVVVLKIKTTNFETHTRNHSLNFHTADDELIIKAAKKLLDAEIATVTPQALKLRLMGIRMASLIDEASIPSGEKNIIKLKDFLLAKSTNQSSKKEFLGIQECSTFKEQNVSVIQEKTYMAPPMQIYSCPICNGKQTFTELSQFNCHIDECLNRIAIKEILAAENSVKTKRSISDNGGPIVKKLKTGNKSERRIEDFFRVKST